MYVATNCPNCGAQVNFPEDATAAVCQYCGSQISSTGEVLPPEAAAPAQVKIDWKNPYVRLVLLFLFVTIVLPTCVGMFGTLIGIFASIFGLIISLLAPIFVAIMQALSH
jgi:uncharacterized paraquat-inducible protein A